MPFKILFCISPIIIIYSKQVIHTKCWSHITMLLSLIKHFSQFALSISVSAMSVSSLFVVELSNLVTV